MAPISEPAVSLRGLTRRFGDLAALDGVDLDIAEGEFVSILGPSGCGKTTMLRIIGGFEYADAGEVRVGGQRMNDLPAHRRPVSTVFQRYALFPHKTVEQNVAFSLRIARRPKAEIAARVAAMLQLVRLDGFEHRMPSSLSGGQAQRVALARALVNHPKVLLLDEPLAALDLKLRQAMQVELRRIQSEVGSTFIFVTHDQEEALTMSDRIVLMNAGHIEQVGTPLDVYRQPRTRFVSQFVGQVNLLEGTVAGGDEDGAVAGGDEEGAVAPVAAGDGDELVTVRIGEHEVCVAGPTGGAPGTNVWLSLRPETLSITAADATATATSSSSAGNAVAGTVESAVFVGSFVRHTVAIGDGRTLQVQAPADDAHLAIATGDDVVVSWSPRSGVLLWQ